MKLPTYDPKDSIALLGILATLELSCDNECIMESATMRAMPHVVANYFALSIDSRMSQSDTPKCIKASADSGKATLQISLHFIILRTSKTPIQNICVCWSHCQSQRSHFTIYTAIKHNTAAGR